MSDPVLNPMLRPAPSALAATQQNGSRPTTGELRADDSFSRALERRMNPAERGVVRDRQEAKRKNPLQGNDEPMRERTETRAHGGAREPDRPADASDRVVRAADKGGDGPGRYDAGRRAASRTSEAGAKSEDSGTGSSAAPATAAPGAPANEAEAAAGLAALLPNVAGLPGTPVAGDLDGLPSDERQLDGAGGRTGASLLVRLLAEAGASTADTSGTDGSGLGDDTGSTAWKTGTEPTGFDVAAAVTGGKQALTGAASLAGTPGAMPQSLQPDAQPGLHAAGFAPAARLEQTPPQLPVPTAAGQPAWAEDVGGRVVWMVGRNESKAELVLTPPTLGKLEVSIHVGTDQTTAHFVAATSAARDALEQAMPRLREVLQQAGISLGQTNVSTSGEQQAQQHGPGRHGASRSAGAAGAIAAAGAAPIATHWVRSGSGVVDTFV